MPNVSSASPQIYRIKVLERHLDTFGHVNNATYLELLEEARWEVITQNGYDLNYLQQVQQGPVILELNMKFKKELRLRESITITTQLLEYESKTGRLQQLIKNAKDELCTEAVMTFGLFDLHKRRLIEPTRAWLKALGVDLR